MIQVIVTPEVSLSDEHVQIHVTGLQPNQLVTLRASLKDDKGYEFQSKAYYRGDAAGEVDLERAEASGGFYQGVLPMGLFWALKSVKSFYSLTKRDVMGSPFRITVEVYDSIQTAPIPDAQPLASRTVERWFVAPGVQRIQITEGRVRGALFLPPGEGPFPGVIDMFGGAGGLVEYRSALLASCGFVSLSLAYFGYDDLPRVLSEVDLEYFEEAAELLLKHPKVLGPGVGVLAVSKGAEIALTMAAFLKQVKATVCINGPSSMNGTPYHYKDLHMPCAPYRTERICWTDSGAVDVSHLLVDPRDPECQNCLIPVERAEGHILFIAGCEDRNLNSKEYAEVAMERLRKHGRKNGSVLFYPGAGHLIEPPCLPFCRMSHGTNFAEPMFWGGELVAHAKAQEHSWSEIQRFFKLHLGHGRLEVSKL
ncbi:acyl-coenzyme A amino acid N-acyltransferase 1-like [Lissotriton helveticus]